MVISSQAGWPWTLRGAVTLAFLFSHSCAGWWLVAANKVDDQVGPLSGALDDVGVALVTAPRPLFRLRDRFPERLVTPDEPPLSLFIVCIQVPDLVHGFLALPPADSI